MEGDSYTHPPLSGSTDEVLSLGDTIFAECVLQTVCGGALCTLELGGLYGSRARTIACEGDHYDHSPPCQSALTLRLGGMGTNSSILHAASGGNQPDPPTDDHYGRSGRDPGWMCDACHDCPHEATPSSPCRGWPCSNGSIIHAASGGSPLCPMSDDHYGRTAEADDHYGHQSQEAQTLPTEFAEAPSSPCRVCPGPNSSILHAASGGPPLCPMPDDHYDRTAEAGDYYGHQSQVAQTPSSELTDFLTSWSHQ